MIGSSPVVRHLLLWSWTHTVNYNSPGTYDVSLSVSGTENTDDYIMTDYISVAANLVELDFLPDCYGEETSWELQIPMGK